MSSDNEIHIIERLAVIETKIDLNSDLRWRMRSLELTVAVLVVVMVGYASGVDLPLFA